MHFFRVTRIRDARLIALIAMLVVAVVGVCYYAKSSHFMQKNSAPDFGPHVVIFDATMPASKIQQDVDRIFEQQQSNQFGSDRYAILFKPGVYHNNIRVGFYTQLMGLGQSPDAVTINGGVEVDAAWHDQDATQNFWREAENLAVFPTSGTMKWAVSQASPMRRLHVHGNMVLDDNGWSSGGFIADTLIDQEINSGMQQQWLSRNSRWGRWTGANWNMVFVGDDNAPSEVNWPDPPHTVIPATPVVREKPYLTIDKHGQYSVMVPALTQGSHGITWERGATAGQAIPIDAFYIAKPETDTAHTLNQALADGRHVLFTPGVYHLTETLHVRKPDTILLGLGLATLQPTTGQPAMLVEDLDGVKIAGLLFDAGVTNSPVLLQIGQSANGVSHANNPTSLHDLFFRVGGAGVGNATVSLLINSHHVIGDDLWIWRADHGDGVGWTINTTTNGLVVNGNDVTIYGLAVEHFHQYQTLWNGNGGAVYFYQSEAPYDVPNQAGWMNGKQHGYASYKVADQVTSHEAWGVGVYCFFSDNPSAKLHNAIEAPLDNKRTKFHGMTTVSLGGTGEITHVISGRGEAANPANQVTRLAE